MCGCTYPRVQMQPEVAVRVETHEFACLAGRRIPGEDPMIKGSLQFDAIHRIEHTGRADFVGIFVEPPALLQRIGSRAASELSDVKWARRRRHAWTPCYCSTRPVTSTPLSPDNGRMEATKPHLMRQQDRRSASSSSSLHPLLPLP